MLHCQVIGVGALESMTMMAYRQLEKHEHTHAVSDLVQIKSSRAAWEILAILSRVTDSSEMKGQSKMNCQRFSGKVNHNNFILAHSSLSNPFIRNMHGRVIPMDGGCVIQYRMEVSTLARIAFAVWFVVMLAISLSKVGSAVLNGIAPGGYDDFVMLFVIITGSLYISNLMVNEGKKLEKEMEQFLLNMACPRKTLTRV